MVDYLKELETLKAKNKLKNTRAIFKNADNLRKKDPPFRKIPYGDDVTLKNKLKNYFHGGGLASSEEVLARGRSSLKYSGNYQEVLGALKAYEDIGEGKRAIPGVIRYIKKVEKETRGYLPQSFYKEVGDFIERNQKQKPSSDLEGRAVAVIASAGILGGIVVSSTGITGNVVSDITSKTNSLIGFGLIAVGIIALIIYKVRKKKPVLSSVRKTKVKKSKKKPRKK